MKNQSQASKISFDDTMDIDRSHSRCHALEPDSSDEDEARERYRLDTLTKSGAIKRGAKQNVAQPYRGPRGLILG